MNNVLYNMFVYIAPEYFIPLSIRVLTPRYYCLQLLDNVIYHHHEQHAYLLSECFPSRPPTIPP